MTQPLHDAQDTVLADGLIGLLKPVVEEIDERVTAVRWAIFGEYLNDAIHDSDFLFLPYS